MAGVAKWLIASGREARNNTTIRTITVGKLKTLALSVQQTAHIAATNMDEVRSAPKTLDSFS